MTPPVKLLTARLAASVALEEARAQYEAAARQLDRLDTAIVRDGAENNPRVMAWRAREAICVLNLKAKVKP